MTGNNVSFKRRCVELTTLDYDFILFTLGKVFIYEETEFNEAKKSLKISQKFGENRSFDRKIKETVQFTFALQGCNERNFNSTW